MSTSAVTTINFDSSKFKTGTSVREMKTDEDMSLFNLIDKDGNGNLSENELTRANNPIVTQNNEEYYAGLNIEKCSKEGRETFLTMDANKDGTLSSDEIKTIADIENKITELKNNLENVTKIAAITGLGVAVAGVITAVLSGGTSLLVAGILTATVGAPAVTCGGSSIYNYYNNNPKDLSENLKKQYPEYREYISNELGKISVSAK